MSDVYGLVVEYGRYLCGECADEFREWQGQWPVLFPGVKLTEGVVRGYLAAFLESDKYAYSAVPLDSDGVDKLVAALLDDVVADSDHT